tara:strand:- start:923 stop:1165 length:243 start_codon:yes stop_codon:yes gene_type:complete
MEEYVKKYKKVWVRGLAIECPLGDALKTCPLRELRKLELADRLKMIDDMGDEQIEEILEVHKECARSREMSKFDKLGNNS